MDFQYNYKSEELSKDEDRESSKEDENEESSEDENEESSEDENEEFSEDENQESSEDENEESSEDENEESSEDENQESSEDENEEVSEDEEEYDNIIDKALDKDKMPSYDNNNEFAPYFKNFTTASLFCWLQKHNISTNAYKDLAEIIHNSQFMLTHVIKNVQRFRKWRQHLPLLSILERSISISSKKTPSTSKNSKMAYQLSISDII